MSNATWLTPAAEAWEARFGKGTFPFGKAAKALAPLREHHLAEEIGDRLAAYLDATEPRFVNLFRFAETFAAWGSAVQVDADGILREP